MKDTRPVDGTLRNVLVPLSLLSDPEGFGGTPCLDCLQGDLRIRGGKVAGLSPRSGTGAPSRMVLPRLTEPHVHLDKCHTISRIAFEGGNLRAAIDVLAQDRLTWTEEDIRHRARRGLSELAEAGCGTVRTHVDWGRPNDRTAPPRAWPVLCELAEEYRDVVTLQIAPLTGIEDLADWSVADRIAGEIARKGGVLGSFVFGQPRRQDGIRIAFKAAADYGLALDFHVDEGQGTGFDGLEMIADAALETGFEGPVLCGHTCSLMDLDGDDLHRLLDKVARAGISVVALPSANLYLQGRRDGTPDRRGLTRVRELRQAGVTTVIGTDNVRDPFCPLGRFDPRQSLALAALAAHLDPPFGRYLPMISTDARAALGLSPGFIDGAAIADLLVFNAGSTADLLAGVHPPEPLTDALQEADA